MRVFYNIAEALASRFQGKKGAKINFRVLVNTRLAAALRRQGNLFKSDLISASLRKISAFAAYVTADSTKTGAASGFTALFFTLILTAPFL
jgi:hypothetical protein